ncbi:iron export ABC transporter permease subunit FetB [Lactobacillus sp. S2-2]|uniref:ABC transporter permease n=1 Tax=Lactobacillus sp. S2-2 TaxID=2692917 RepID=UPI001F263EEC|nr:iron export ABC transporter permease subunit FetB [Lactobacillus sp. S2-2]MCF6515247.1 iron export ABC transporter permease subunit FetB [Lactobacillus sp. S2-2]
MNNIDISNSSLFLTAGLIFISLAVGWYEKLKINKSIIYAALRAVVQLFVVGYVLKYVFAIDNWILTFTLMVIIIVNSSINASNRSDGLKNGLWISLAAISSSTIIVIGVITLSGAIKFVPSQVIPFTGMIASNSMVALGLCYRNMNAGFHDRRQQVMEKLALGADVSTSCKDILRDSIKTGLQPTIDTAKTVGLVALPGMMSGLILAGVDPVHAIKYQIMVIFMLLGITAITTIIACYLGYRSFYNSRMQLTRF